MDNPYSTDTEFTLPIREQSWRLREWIMLAVLVGLAAHGMADILEDAGYIVWHDGEQHFWFEEDLKRWIHEM